MTFHSFNFAFYRQANGNFFKKLLTATTEQFPQSGLMNAHSSSKYYGSREQSTTSSKECGDKSSN